MKERIERLLRIAHEVGASEALRDAIAVSTGLSRPNVDRALAHHLEREAHLDDTAPTEAVAVILSANVFVGALRAIAIAMASGGDVVVRPSRRDPTFARALVEALSDPGVRLDEALDVATITRGEIHAYGTDETIADIRRRAHVPVRGHGAGMGVAVVTAGASIEEAARALADDVVIFDQRGCLSPRIALAPPERADALAEALHAELERLAIAIPRGEVSSEERAASDRYIATMTYACRVLVGVDHAVGVAPAVIAAPAYRHVHIVATDDPPAILAPIARAITCVGSDDLDAARALAPPGARIARLGAMQRPPLDGPVDLRGMLSS